MGYGVLFPSVWLDKSSGAGNPVLLTSSWTSLMYGPPSEEHGGIEPSVRAVAAGKSVSQPQRSQSAHSISIIFQTFPLVLFEALPWDSRSFMLATKHFHLCSEYAPFGPSHTYHRTQLLPLSLLSFILRPHWLASTSRPWTIHLISVLLHRLSLSPHCLTGQLFSLQNLAQILGLY